MNGGERITLELGVASPWPDGARAALSLSFDNLGEAAELELGAIGPDAPLGNHPTATEVLPALLDRLAERELAATFFVEGINAEIYPDLLREIAGRGHELALHAWRHEQWDQLPAAAQAENLARCLTAFERLGLEPLGLRPPGGQLGAGDSRSSGKPACATARRPAPVRAPTRASRCCLSSGVMSTRAACCRRSPMSANR